MATSGKPEALALAIASGSTIKEAAVIANCSARSAYRLSSSPKFRSRVASIRSEITGQAVGRLTHAATFAADTLLALLSEDFEPSARLQAAKAILASLGPLAELSELRSRLDALERAK